MRPPLRALPPALGAALFLLLSTSTATAQATYHVDTGGDDANTGLDPTDAWQTVARVRSASLQPGDSVLFRRGQAWDEHLDLSGRAGAPGQPITYGAHGTGDPPVLRQVTFRDCPHSILQDITVDLGWADADAVRFRGSSPDCVVRDCEIRNGQRDGIDAANADRLLIERCHVHHFLAGTFGSDDDAHGIVATDVEGGLTIRDTEVHHCSGDSFQTDPNRGPDKFMHVLIEGCHFWTGPLLSDFVGWNAGESPGENAIDTKVEDEDWDASPRATMTIRDTVAHGFSQPGPISNRAAFNMKEKVEAVFDGVTVFDCEQAFRLRGTRGAAHVTLRNVVMHDVATAIRAEDDLPNLRVLNCTFGDGIGRILQHAGGSGGTGSWDWRNCAFLDVPPAEADDPSNVLAAPGDFEDTTARDYRLAPSSALADAGDVIVEVATDRDGVPRPQGVGFDVGAHEGRACAGGFRDEVVGVRVSRTEMTWADAGVGLTHDVLGGTLSELASDRGLTAAECLSAELPETRFADGRPGPGEGEGYWYLVRGRDACSAGHFGSDSFERRRVPGASCP